MATINDVSNTTDAAIPASTDVEQAIAPLEVEELEESPSSPRGGDDCCETVFGKTAEQRCQRRLLVFAILLPFMAFAVAIPLRNWLVRKIRDEEAATMTTLTDSPTSAPSDGIFLG